MNKLELIMSLHIEEYKQRLDLIIEVLNELARMKVKLALEFLEISRYSFNCFNDDNKPKEGYILKRNDSTRIYKFYKKMSGYFFLFFKMEYKMACFKR
jgi:hypothetical protein